ncbi:unnamed protein product [Rhizopus stolonifer]
MAAMSIDGVQFCTTNNTTHDISVCPLKAVGIPSRSTEQSPSTSNGENSFMSKSFILGSDQSAALTDSSLTDSSMTDSSLTDSVTSGSLCNRQCPFHHLAKKFSEEAMVRHIVLGGSWDNVRQRGGFSDNWEFADNNHASTKLIVTGTSALFEFSQDGFTRRVLGKVFVKTKKEVNTMAYVFVAKSGPLDIMPLVSSCIYEACEQNMYGNILLTRLSQNDFFGNIESVKILEIHNMTNLFTLNSVEYLTLNSVKFGTLW